MADLKEIIDKEKLRENKRHFLTVHLYQDGSFYRAYDWSAWLCVNYIKSDMKVTHRKTKTTDVDFAFVGFPLTSIEKYTPDGATTEVIGEKMVDILLDTNLIDDAVSYTTLSEAVVKWKEGIPLNKTNERKNTKDSAAERPLEVNDILKEILAYPLESRTLLDNAAFLSELKVKISNVIL